MLPQGDGPGGNLFFSHDPHVRNLSDFGCPDLVTDLLVASVDDHAETFPAHPGGDLLGVSLAGVGNRQQRELYRCQPDREVAGVMFDQDADETLERTEHGAMDHHRAMLLAVLADILQLEAFRHGEVELDGAQLPAAAQRVAHMEIDLGAVEGAVARIELVFDLFPGQGAGQRRFRPLPDLQRADVFLLRAGRQFDEDLLEVETRVHLEDQFDDADDLILDLLRGAEDVRVVLSELAHAEQPVQLPRFFVAMHHAQLGVLERQLAVAVRRVAVEQQVPGAVHRLDRVWVLVDGGEIHPILVVVPVAAEVPERFVQDDRSLDLLVVLPVMHLEPEGADLVVDHHAVGMPEGKAGALRVQREEVEFPADFTVIPLLGLFQELQMLLELPGVREGDSVDPLQLFVLLIAAQVGAGDLQHFQRFDPAGRGEVRPDAEVDEIALPVDAYHLAFLELVDQFQLVGLAHLLEQTLRLLATQFAALVGEVLLDQLLHPLFDPGQVMRGDRLGEIDVVVESLFDGGSDPEPGIGIQLLDRLGQNVSGAVPEDLFTRRGVEVEQFQPAVCFDREIDTDDPVVQSGGDGALGQAVGDGSGNGVRSDPAIELFARFVGKGNPHLVRHVDTRLVAARGTPGSGAAAFVEK